ncbi:hypothetical protein GCM10023116_28390 [Kistimonas scapharcae]|uniref:Uncharacterized protein n=2 Tax=Kistimonas scapharcae TaxID=1036133 RepID=A0ABP8V5J5_9GAMM
MLLVVIVSQTSFAQQDEVATRQQAMDVITQFHAKRAAMQMRHQKQYDAGWSVQLQRKNMEEEEMFLLNSAVIVESYYREAPLGEVRAEALSDVAGLKSHITFEEGMLNRSGSGVVDDRLEWGQKHFEARMVYYTVRILEYEDNPPVNVDQWLKVMHLTIPEG